MDPLTKPTEVTAGDEFSLSSSPECPWRKAIPRQPHGALPGSVNGSLKVQRQGGTTIGDQVEPGEGQMGSILEGLKGQSRQEETAWAYQQMGWVGAQTLPLTSCVTVGKLPQFHL